MTAPPLDANAPSRDPVVDVGEIWLSLGAAQAKARMSPDGLLGFVPQTTPRFKRPDHLRPVAEILDLAMREPIRACISVPPRHGKTEIILHSFAYMLKHEPDAQIGYISYEATIARSKSRLARDYAERSGVTLREDANALHEWLTPVGGGLRCGGVGGPLTGHGFRLLVIDDPVKNREEAESILIRQRNWDWLTSTAETRIEPTGSIVIMHTRWHEDDMIGRCEKEREKFDASGGTEGTNWLLVNLQAIDDTTGSALWEERWPAEILLKKRAAVGEYDWAALYQGRPRPKGSKLFGDPARYDAPSIDGRRILISVDVAATKKTSANYTVAVVAAYSGEGDALAADVLEVHRWQETVPEVARRLEKLQGRWGGARIVVEASGVGKGVPQTLLDNNPRLLIVEVYPSTDKFTRAQAYAGAWNQGRVRLGLRVPDIALANRAGEVYWGENRELGEYVRVHQDFTGVNDPDDDDVDAGAHGYNYALANPPPKVTPPVKAPPVRTVNWETHGMGLG